MKLKRSVEIKPDPRDLRAEQVRHDMGRFFASCPNVFAVQDLMVCIAAGQLLSAELVDVTLLPHVLLLHAVAPEPGVVDDAVRLTERILEEYECKYHGPRFWHPDGYLVSGLVNGTCDPDSIAEDPYHHYISEVYKELTNGYVKSLFSFGKTGQQKKQA